MSISKYIDADCGPTVEGRSESVPQRISYQLQQARQRVKDLEEAEQLLAQNPSFARLLTLMRNI